jgi:hypothetical protein
MTARSRRLSKPGKKLETMSVLTAVSRTEPGPAAGPVKSVSVISTGTVQIRC